MCPGRVKSLGREWGEASARAVRLRSCAEIPVVVPCRTEKSKNWCGGGLRRKVTVLVIYCDGVRCPMPVLILGDHHGDFELL
jgi:hypothetical protein